MFISKTYLEMTGTSITNADVLKAKYMLYCILYHSEYLK